MSLISENSSNVLYSFIVEQVEGGDKFKVRFEEKFGF
jgi:hypothetical protein